MGNHTSLPLKTTTFPRMPSCLLTREGGLFSRFLARTRSTPSTNVAMDGNTSRGGVMRTVMSCDDDYATTCTECGELAERLRERKGKGHGQEREARAGSPTVATRTWTESGFFGRTPTISCYKAALNQHPPILFHSLSHYPLPPLPHPPPKL